MGKGKGFANAVANQLILKAWNQAVGSNFQQKIIGSAAIKGHAILFANKFHADGIALFGHFFVRSWANENAQPAIRN
jgi:long-subunit acyl-CoA synthetase (AMP-forming)